MSDATLHLSIRKTGSAYVEGVAVSRRFAMFVLPPWLCKEIRARASDDKPLTAVLHLTKMHDGRHDRAFRVSRDRTKMNPYWIVGMRQRFCEELPKALRVRLRPGQERYFVVTGAEVTGYPEAA